MKALFPKVNLGEKVFMAFSLPKCFYSNKKT